MWIDTHAHLADEQLSGSLDSIVENARSMQVTRIVCVATDLVSSSRCVEIADRFQQVFASVGVHPNQCHDSNESEFQLISELARAQSRVVAIGETGLDRFWDFAPFDLQVDWFHQHIELSLKTGLPLIIHMRDCETDILNCLREHKNKSLRGVMHSFVGDPELASQFLDLGMYISFSGMVTFKNNQQLREVAAFVPDDRILIETDSPYLSPHPVRNSRPNHPALIVHTAESVAAARNLSLPEFSVQTSQNALALFGPRMK